MERPNLGAHSIGANDRRPWHDVLRGRPTLCQCLNGQSGARILQQPEFLHPRYGGGTKRCRVSDNRSGMDSMDCGDPSLRDHRDFQVPLGTVI